VLRLKLDHGELSPILNTDLGLSAVNREQREHLPQ